MKWVVMYLALVYLVACADAVSDHGDLHSIPARIIRALCWPFTITSWFKSGNVRLHRLLNILWTVLIAGWFLSLLADRL